MENKFLLMLGQAIKAKRMALHLSPEELAWRCDMTKNGLGKIELGRIQVRITTLIRIMKELELSFIDVHEIFCD